MAITNADYSETSEVPEHSKAMPESVDMCLLVGQSGLLGTNL